MPIYEYQCDACEHRFERRQSFHDEPVRECPECQGVTRRLLHPAGIIFKGSGWYVTDSRPSSANSNGERSNGKSEKSVTDGVAESAGVSKTENGSSKTDKATSKTEAASSSTASASKKSDSGTTSSASSAAST